MDETLLNDYQALRNQIKLYGEDFDVVLIAELFDESLIVMKDFLCWNDEDILYLKVKDFFLVKNYQKLLETTLKIDNSIIPSFPNTEKLLLTSPL